MAKTSSANERDPASNGGTTGTPVAATEGIASPHVVASNDSIAELETGDGSRCAEPLARDLRCWHDAMNL